MESPCPSEPVGISTPGVQAGVGVPLEAAAELAQGGQLLPGEITQAGQDGIERRGAVALGEDEAVPVGPAEIAGPGAHLGKEQGHQDVGGR